jgi:hypothetical protein
LNGFQFDGGVYIVPLVYSVWRRGYPASVPDADEDGDAEVPFGGVVDDELVQAAAVARVRAAATAMVHQRTTLVLVHLVFIVRLTCSYLLTKECWCLVSEAFPYGHRIRAREKAERPFCGRPLVTSYTD